MTGYSTIQYINRFQQDLLYYNLDTFNHHGVIQLRSSIRKILTTDHCNYNDFEIFDDMRTTIMTDVKQHNFILYFTFSIYLMS